MGRRARRKSLRLVKGVRRGVIGGADRWGRWLSLYPDRHGWWNERG